ncbi:hypothetical protein H0H93_001735, partial [Arthromyces matolae]
RSGKTPSRSQTEASGSSGVESLAGKGKSTRRSVQFHSAGTEENTVIGQVGEGDHAPANNDDLNDAQLQRINDLVESFESQQHPKSEVLLEILAVISGSKCSTVIKNRTATEYIGVLDEIEFTRRAREERIGGNLAMSIDQNRTQTVTEDERMRRYEDGDDGDRDGDRDGNGDEEFGDKDNGGPDADSFLKSIALCPKRKASGNDTELI